MTSTQSIDRPEELCSECGSTHIAVEIRMKGRSIDLCMDCWQRMCYLENWAIATKLGKYLDRR